MTSLYYDIIICVCIALVPILSDIVETHHWRQRLQSCFQVSDTVLRVKVLLGSSSGLHSSFPEACSKMTLLSLTKPLELCRARGYEIILKHDSF